MYSFTRHRSPHRICGPPGTAAHPTDHQVSHRRVWCTTMWTTLDLPSRGQRSFDTWISVDACRCCGGLSGDGHRHWQIHEDGQLGDGREAAAADYVLAHARRGDVDDVLATIDKFAYEHSFLVNVGDEKGALLDAAVRRADPRLALELGTYCGYGALRIARSAQWRRCSRWSCPRRTLTSPGASGPTPPSTIASLASSGRLVTVAVRWTLWRRSTVLLLGFGLPVPRPRQVRLFPDLRSIMERGWLHPGSIVVADNVRLPGSPKFRAYMREQQGKHWDTREHKTHVEYQTLLPDLVLESEYMG